jgi:flagellar M-ring protein FliF
MAEATDLLDRLGGWRRLATLGVGALAIALIVVVSRWATAPAMVPMVTGVPLETSAVIEDRLNQAGIPYELSRGGADVLVAAADLARARVAVARDGLPSSGRPGLELFDKPAYAMTDFTQRINYRRALEGELERTIGTMRGIASAQVHLAIQETSSFRRADTPAEASVVLKLSGGEDPTPDVVRGIAQLVASSVDGLESDRVTVVDDAGRLLSSPDDQSSVTGLTSRQLGVQREVESHLRLKAEEIVGQIVGRGNARVQVAAALNFDRVERRTENVDPERQAPATEQKAEIVPGPQGGAGSSNQATTYETSRSTETFAGTIGSIRRLTVAVLLNDRQVGTGDTARVQPRPPEELARIETLVRNAVGLDTSRGDQLTVVSVPFAVAALPIEAPPATPSMLQTVQSNQRLILNVLALVFAFVIAVMALKSMKGLALKPREPGTALAAGRASALPSPDRFEPAPPVAAGLSQPSRVLAAMPEAAAVSASHDLRQRIASTVEEQPESAARLVRSMMRET